MGPAHFRGGLDRVRVGDPKASLTGWGLGAGRVVDRMHELQDDFQDQRHSSSLWRGASAS